MNRFLSLLFLLSLLSLLTTSTTTLSTSKCPEQFDLATANKTQSSSSSSMVDLLYSNLYSQSDQAKIQASFHGGSSKEVNNRIMAPNLLIPFILIAVAFFVTFVIALACCIFEKSCPPCKSWQRNFVTRPYQRSELKCVTLFALLFSIGILITCVVGFVFYPKFQQGIQNTKCALYMSLDVALNGDLDKNWGGFSQIKSQIGNVSSLLSTASTAVSTDLSNNQWLIEDMAALKQTNLNIYKDNNQSTVLSPDPVATQSAITGNTDLPTITPLFISQGLGPNGTNNTMVNDIDEGIRVTQQVSLQGNKVYQAALLLANSANTINTNLNKALDMLTLNSNYLTSIRVQIDAFTSTTFDSLFNWGLYFVQGVLGFILASSLFIIMGIIAVYFFELHSCTTSVHLGWVCYGIMYFGIVAMTFIFFSFGGVSYQFCQFYGQLVTDSNAFSAYAQVTGANQFNRFFQKIDTCLYGNGNIMSEFSIKEQTQTVSDLYSQINTFLNMRDNSTTLYVDTSVSPTKISNWITAMQQYRLGVYIDSNVNNEDNPQIALDGLNKYTNNGTNGSPPSCTNDYWVFDSSNCTHNATEAPYIADTVGSGTSFASTGTLCIGFNQKFHSNNNNSWAISDIANRYVSKRQCQNNTQSYDAIINYATSLINYRDSRINLYQNLKDQLSALLTQNNNFNTKLSTFTTDVNTFVSSTTTLNTLVTNAINGLDASSDCRTVGDHLRVINNVFCKKFVYTAVQFGNTQRYIGICCLVLLAIMIGGVITGAVFAIRYGRVAKNTKVVRAETASLQELHSETFDKPKASAERFERRQESSSSSSSSDQD